MSAARELASRLPQGEADEEDHQGHAGRKGGAETAEEEEQRKGGAPESTWCVVPSKW